MKAFLKKTVKSMFKIKDLYNCIYNRISVFGFQIDYLTFPEISGRILLRGEGRVKLGKGVIINSGVEYNPIGGDIFTMMIAAKPESSIQIGNNVGISNSTIHAFTSVTIGDNVMIGGGTKIWDSDFHSINPEERIFLGDRDIKSIPIIIHDNVFIGGGSYILKGVTIGKNSVVAAASVVTKSIPENEVWGGNPAKFLKKISNE